METTSINAEENEELFWALHGAGQYSFGVVTSITLEIFDDYRPLLYTMKRSWPIDNAAQMLKFWSKSFQEEIQLWEKELCIIVTLTNSALSLETLYFGEPQNGPKVNMIFDNPNIPPSTNNHGMVSFLEWNELHRSRDNAYKYIFKSGFVPNMDDELIDVMVGHDVTECPEGGEYEITIEFLYGSITELSPSYTPFPHRSPSVHVICCSKYRTYDDEWDSWSDFFGEVLIKKRTGLSAGWADGNISQLANALSFWKAENYSILKELKKTFDPSNYFSIPQSY